MLIDAKKSCLLIVDVQEKLTPLIFEHEKLIENCQWLMRLAKELNIPTLVSEQYPQGLGETIVSLKQTAQQAEAVFMEKVAFSCAADAHSLKTIQAINKSHIVIAGIEAHVCVLQTAVELQQLGLQVFVVADAISSRQKSNVCLARSRMRAAGVQIVSREMVLFEWLRQAATPLFKQISKNFLRKETN